MHNVESVDQARWAQAQQRELAEWTACGPDGDDWNEFWKRHFDGFNFLRGRPINSLMEVGCGPWAKNTLNVLQVIPVGEIILLDPLMPQYVALGKSVTKVIAVRISAPLEELRLSRKVDLIICINVLDHVRSVSECFERMKEHLSPGGILIVGQDLSNDEDFKLCPESWVDVAHPIKLDMETCNKHLEKYKPIFLKILGRHEGRNPNAHYATLLFAGLVQ